MHSCKITSERSESVRKRRIALYKSDQLQQENTVKHLYIYILFYFTFVSSSSYLCLTTVHLSVALTTVARSTEIVCEYCSALSCYNALVPPLACFSLFFRRTTVNFTWNCQSQHTECRKTNSNNQRLLCLLDHGYLMCTVFFVSGRWSENLTAQTPALQSDRGIGRKMMVKLSKFPLK